MTTKGIGKKEKERERERERENDEVRDNTHYWKLEMNK